MKKMKKLFAVLLAFAMVMGMSLTTFAETDNVTPYQADITVKGLVNGESTTVNAYAAVYLNSAENQWVVAEWAKPYIVLNQTTNKYEITEAGELALHTAPSGQTPIQTKNTTGTTVKFENLPVGAYVIVAAGEGTVYTTLVAETYKQDETYMVAEDVTVVAKADKYNVDKKVDDEFVKVGQVVNFDVTTTFPNFENPTDASTFVITDTPTNLTIDASSVTVKIANAPLTSGYSVDVDATNGVLTVDLSDSIGLVNANAGKTVLVEYSATVTGTTNEEQAFKNIVVATRDNAELGKDNTIGYTGAITITKTDDNESNPTVLNGAQFKVYKNYDATEGATNTALKFTKVNDVTVGEGDDAYTVAVYKLDANGTDIIEATNGYVKVIGLDEGSYWFEETKAPAGYSINTAGITKTITDPDNKQVENDVTAHIFAEGTLKDTKLSSLPSTGGIGTAVFTIGGCAIMIAAAYFFFVSRKKES